MRLAGQWTEAAAHYHSKSTLAIAHHRPQPDIVDRAQHAIFFATGESDFELAWQTVGQLFVQKSEGYFLRVGMHVEDFVFQQSAQGAGGHVADSVVAGF